MQQSYLRVLAVLLLVFCMLLVACGEENPTSSFSFPTPTPTVTPPFAAFGKLTPTATPDPNANYVPPTATPTVPPPTPIVAPTPLTPREMVISGDDLGISEWPDSQINWASSGNIFLLHILNQNQPINFYFLVRPPSSVVASFRLSRTTFSTFQWSPDNRFLSFIQQDADGNAGPVKLIDTQGAVYQPVELFKGPCSSAMWLGNDRLVATCGNTVYYLKIDATRIVQPESIFKLDEQNRFPGSPLSLSLIVRALPSPDGKTLALFGLQTSATAKIPIGEVGFLDLATKRFNVLDRNDRPVAPVEWTPDSKYLILRNLTVDWTVGYTYDFYLAETGNYKITTNLTKSNSKCDPVLSKSASCQGQQASTYQTSRILFAPDGNRYFVTGLRYVPRPSIGLQTAERLLTGTVIDGKLSQVIEHSPGGKIVGLTWLPNGRYFYSWVADEGGSKAYLDGKAYTVTTTTQSRPTTPTTRAAGDDSGSVRGFSFQQTSPVSNSPVSSTQAPSTTAAGNTPVPTISITTSENPTTIVVTIPVTPPTPVILPTIKPEPTPTPTPKASKDRPILYGYYVSPTGNWLASLEKISLDQAVQFQLRLIPVNLK